MGKRKRPRSRSRSDLHHKMKKLEEKLQRYRRPAERSSSSITSQDVTDPGWSANEYDYDNDNNYHDDVIMLEDEEPIAGPSGLHQHHHTYPTPVDEDTAPLSSVVQVVNTENPPSTPADEAAVLDPDILQMLGDDPTNQKEYGPDIHNDLASRWSHIISNDLDKDTKQELLKIYMTPENCKNLRAPKLNLEVKAALNDVSIKKDFYNQSKQTQLSSALSAIGSVLNLIILSKDASMQKLVKPLNDAARLICDCHYKESVSRKFDITKILNKETKDLVRNTKIDEFLFDVDLTDQLKTHKAITRSGLEMKAASAPRTVYKQFSSTQNQRGALNARGTTRAIVGGLRRNPAPRRPPPPPPPQRERRYPRQTAATASRNYSSRQRTTRRRF